MVLLLLYACYHRNKDFPTVNDSKHRSELMQLGKNIWDQLSKTELDESYMKELIFQGLILMIIIGLIEAMIFFYEFFNVIQLY